MPTPIEDRESFIHDRVLQDLIAAHLYSTTVEEKVEIFDMTLSSPDHAGIRTINYKTIKNKEVELIVHS